MNEWKGLCFLVTLPRAPSALSSEESQTNCQVQSPSLGPHAWCLVPGWLVAPLGKDCRAAGSLDWRLLDTSVRERRLIEKLKSSAARE